MAVETPVKDRKGRGDFSGGGGKAGPTESGEKKEGENERSRKKERETGVWVARVPLTRRGGRGRNEETHRDRLRRRKARARVFFYGEAYPPTPSNATDR